MNPKENHEKVEVKQWKFKTRKTLHKVPLFTLSPIGDEKFFLFVLVYRWVNRTLVNKLVGGKRMNKLSGRNGVSLRDDINVRSVLELY